MGGGGGGVERELLFFFCFFFPPNSSKFLHFNIIIEFYTVCFKDEYAPFIRAVIQAAYQFHVTIPTFEWICLRYL